MSGTVEESFAQQAQHVEPNAVDGYSEAKAPCLSSREAYSELQQCTVLSWLQQLQKALEFLAKQLPGAIPAAPAAAAEATKQQRQTRRLTQDTNQLGTVLAGAIQRHKQQQQQGEGPAAENVNDPYTTLRCIYDLGLPELGQQLQQLGAEVVGGIPVPYCCNTPGCSKVGSYSEIKVVASSRCSGCKIARYCCQECQVKHWKVHKAACTRLQARSSVV